MAASQPGEGMTGICMAVLEAQRRLCECCWQASCDVCGAARRDAMGHCGRPCSPPLPTSSSTATRVDSPHIHAIDTRAHQQLSNIHRRATIERRGPRYTFSNSVTTITSLRRHPDTLSSHAASLTMSHFKNACLLPSDFGLLPASRTTLDTAISSGSWDG